jgi:hypothetical protein
LQTAFDFILVNRIACFGQVARERFSPSMAQSQPAACNPDFKSPALTRSFQRISAQRPR